MAILLSVESSTGICSAAVHENGKLLASGELHIRQSAASSLAVIIQDVLKISGIAASALDGVAVAAGPGSYTGLRIGVATAKGICYAMNIPLLSVNTLELLAYQVSTSYLLNSEIPFAGKKEGLLLCPMLDARRMEVYCMLADSELNVIEPTSAKIIDPESFSADLMSSRILFFGDGSEKCCQVLAHPNAMFLANIFPSSAKLGELAFKKFSGGESEDLSSFEPLYLKDFVAKKPKVQI